MPCFSGGNTLKNEDILNYQAFLNGDMSGFENLVLAYKDSLIYFLMRYVKQIEIAEDLAQDAFVEILVHKERFQLQSNFKTYLYTIGRNKAVDYLRKYSRQMVSDISMEEERDTFNLEEKVIQKEEYRVLYRQIRSLKKEYQLVICLIDLEGFSYKETANIMKKTVPQIKVMVHRARKALEKSLRKEGYVHEK